MKTNIVLGVVILLLSMFSYHLWKKMTEKDAEVVALGEKVNQATITEKEHLDKIKTLTKELKDIEGKRPQEVIYVEVERKVVVKEREFILSTDESGKEAWGYSDFRLDLMVYPETKTLDYTLNQRYRMHLYILNDKDYRAEMVELDLDGKPVGDPFKIEEFTVQREKTPTKWNTGFNLMIGGGGVWDGKMSGNGYLQANFISHGVTHLDSDWRLLNVGVGTKGLTVAPVSYRASNHIPFLNDIFIDPQIGYSYDGRLMIGLGISSTL